MAPRATAGGYRNGPTPATLPPMRCAMLICCAAGLHNEGGVLHTN